MLGLELGEHNGVLSLYDENRSAWIAPPKERVAAAEVRAENAEARATQEAQARQSLETQLADALGLLEQLQKENNDG
ncbi:hypothetical protein F4Y59_11660 [Candidatus Poribacteria bacterium]|nr:hypothetical protein [Candidatus Poribacteria bacterium]